MGCERCAGTRYQRTRAEGSIDLPQCEFLVLQHFDIVFGNLLINLMVNQRFLKNCVMRFKIFATLGEYMHSISVHSLFKL